MSKLYHITVAAHRNGAWSRSPVLDTDIIASNTAVAIRRALDTKALRTAKHVRLECNVSNHGEYDKAQFTCFNHDGKLVYGPRREDGTYYRAPSHIRRAQAEERLGIEAQRIIDTCNTVDNPVCVVKARSRSIHVTVKRAGCEHLNP